MHSSPTEFFARQFFLITALLIVFCLGHNLLAGSLFSPTAREAFQKNRAEQMRRQARSESDLQNSSARRLRL